MITAFSSPLIVRPDGTSLLIERVPLSGVESREAYTEDWLQRLLYQHPDSLPVVDLDDAFSNLTPVCRELSTPAGDVDVVYITPTGRLVIVEAKLWRNPEARRKVIGQILDYAKELSRFSFERLDSAVRAARRKLGEEEPPLGLADIVRAKDPTLDEAQFCDSIVRNLRRGEMLLLIVGDGIKENVGAITDFLEGHASLHFTFGLVEMAIYRLPDGGQLVQPRVLAQSTIVRRVVVELRDGQMSAREEELVDVVAEEEVGPGERGDLLERRAMFDGFWTRFLQRLELDDKSQPIKAPSKGTNQVFHMPEGSECWVSAYLARAKGRAGVFLTYRKNAVGRRLYAALEEQRDAIEAELGEPLEWDDWGIIKKCAFLGEMTDPGREDVVDWLVEETRRFIGVFRPRLEKLVRESV